MTKHKTEDYKISAVKYYLNNDKGDGYKKTCKIFDCKNTGVLIEKRCKNYYIFILNY